LLLLSLLALLLLLRPFVNVVVVVERWAQIANTRLIAANC
jgi:hypothetical protein